MPTFSKRPHSNDATGIGVQTASRENKKLKRKIRELARDAASRTLNGNGASPSLPPLPKADDNGKGLETLFSHPFGALPYGNIYMNMTSSGDGNADADSVRRNGLGNLMRCLNDDQVVSVLQFVDARSLSRVACASRFLYVSAHHDELWRDVTLRKYGKEGFSWCGTWKDTYIREELEHLQQRDHDHDHNQTGKKSIVFCKHKPMAMKGIYSDTFFRSWLCRSFALQDSWLKVSNVQIEDANGLTSEKFVREYEEKNIPVVVRGATKAWPASQKWDKEYLTKQTENITFRATSGVAPLPANFDMESYARYCDSATEEAPLYLFDRTFSQKCPDLLDDFYPALKKSCPFFDDEAPHGHDLFSLLGKGKRPDHRWIIIGPKRSGSSFHIDPNATHAWNAPIKGRKKWIFYPPGCNPPGVFPSPSGDDVIMPISLGEWFLTHWNDHVKERTNPDKSKRPLECTVGPGDILFVPHGWWHCVLNLDDGMSIALTQNYVSSSNLPDVLRFLKTRPQQISGCRDRREAIQPDVILGIFQEKLRDSRPDLLKECLAVADEGWQCNAWTDALKNEDSVTEKKPKFSILQKAKMPTSNLSAISDGQEKLEPCTGSQGGFSFSFL